MLFVCALLFLSFASSFASQSYDVAIDKPEAVKPGSVNYFSFQRPEGLREFWLYAPKQYDDNKPWPLAFYFHGYQGDYKQGIDLNMTMDADNFGYLMIFGRGTPASTGFLSWNGGVCCNFPNSTSKVVDDVQFTRTALQLTQAAVNVDAKRVYSMGWSNGAFMSERLACEAADIFAGIAADEGTVGIEPGGKEGMRKCDSSFGSQHLSLLHFHGTADPVVSWVGSGSLNGSVVAVLDDITRWTRRLGCSSSVGQTFNDGTFSNMVWNSCRGGSSVEFMTIRNGNHWWWTQYNTNPGFPMAAYSMTFFNRISQQQAEKPMIKKHRTHNPPSSDWRDYENKEFQKTMDGWAMEQEQDGF